MEFDHILSLNNFVEIFTKPLPSMPFNNLVDPYLSQKPKSWNIIHTETGNKHNSLDGKITLHLLD